MTGSVAEPGLNTLCIIKSLSYADIDEMDPVPFLFRISYELELAVSA